MKKFLICFLAFVITTRAIRAQKKDDNIIGAWKGTSLCQQKPSSCHDEDVVYHFSKGKNDSTYSVQASKIINGAEDDMGTLEFVYNGKNKILKCIMKDHQGRASVWLFKLDGEKMHGTLTENENTLYRVVELKKSNSSDANSASINDAGKSFTGHK